MANINNDMGKSYKEGTCKRCGKFTYVNDHHIIPKRVKKKNNKETVRLCLICPIELHTILPDEKQNEAFYKKFTNKWLLTIILILIVGITIFSCK